MIELDTPSGTWRDIQYGDEADVFTILRNTNRDGKRFTPRRAEQAVHKWVNDMFVEPGDYPVQPDSLFREAFILHHPNGDPLSLIILLVRGGNDPKNWPLPMSTMTVEYFAIAPDYQGQGRSGPIMRELTKLTFNEGSQPDLLLYDIVDDPAMQSWRASRTFRAEEIVTGKDGNPMNRVVETKEEHVQRMLDNPREAATQVAFTDTRNP